MRWWQAAGLAALAMAQPALAAEWNPVPWVWDLHQMRAALDEKYANRDWLVKEREVDLDAIFARAEKQLTESANDDGDARAIFERLIRRIDDGHVDIQWPERRRSGTPAQPAGPAPSSVTALCTSQGYREGMLRPGTMAAASGYKALPGDVFQIGVLPVAGEQLGVVRIGIFDPHGFPQLCEEAVGFEKIDPARPCDDVCTDRIVTRAFARLTAILEERIAALKAAGATVLLVDLSGNGGGTEWAEAAVRMFSGKQLQSARMAFMRGEHWTRQWGDLATKLRAVAKTAPKADRTRLLAWAAEADAAKAEAQRRCSADAPCERLGRAGYGTGLVGSARAGEFAGKDWAVNVFTPAQFPYHDGVWTGPLLVLTDQETWSAAEEFTALLQDNRAAVVIGARTGGAGCGHTWGGTPTKLTNSGATFQLPDCARLRADGSNEVRGILPDVPVPIRANDGLTFKAGLVVQALPEAVTLARQQTLKVR